MHVEEHGPPDGTAVVFVHGSLVAGWMWLGQVEALPSYRCLLPDLPGLGRSAGVPWAGFPDAADRLAGIIRGRCAGGTAHVVGLSLGGIVALHLATRHGDAVRSLLVSGVPEGRISPALRALSRAVLALYRRPRGARLVARALGIPPDESLAAFLETARQTDPHALRRISREVAREPLPAGLERVTAPTLAVAGERDTAPARRAVPYLAATVPNAVGRIVPGVGHQWNAEEPELFTDMVRAWIDEGRVDERLSPAPQVATGGTRGSPA